MLGELWMFSAQIHCPGPQTLLYIWNRGRITHKQTPNDKTTHARSQHHHHRPGGDVTELVHWGGGGGGGGGKERKTHTPNIDPPPPSPHPVLPGITEIVFNALNTLNVRRAETLPRFTNSVIYLQDQTKSYGLSLFTVETTCIKHLLCIEPFL